MNHVTGIGAWLLTIAMLGVFVLAWGSWRIWRMGDRQKGVLMAVVAVILLANVLIWVA